MKVWTVGFKSCDDGCWETDKIFDDRKKAFAYALTYWQSQFNGIFDPDYHIHEIEVE